MSMNEERDVPSVAEVVQTNPIESINDDLAGKVGKPRDETPNTIAIRSPTVLEWFTSYFGKMAKSVEGFTKDHKLELLKFKEDAKVKFDDLNAYLQAERDENSQLTKENEELKCELALGSTFIDILKNSQQKSDAKIDDLNTEISENIRARNEIDSQVSLLNEQISQLTEKLEAYKEREAESKSLIVHLQDEVKSKSEKIANLELGLLESKSYMKAEFHRYKLGLLESKSYMKAEFHRYKRELEDVKAKSELETRIINGSLQAERDKISSFMKEIEELKCNLRSERATISKLAKELEESKLESLEAKCNMKSESERCKREVEDVKAKSEMKSRSLNEFLPAEREKNSQLTKELEVCKAKYVESNSLITELQYQVKHMSEKIMNLEEREELAAQLMRKFETVEINLASLHIKGTEFTIRVRCPEMSKLADDNHSRFSQSTMVAGMNWKLSLYKNGDHLAFYLLGFNTVDADNESCSVLFDFQLFSQKTSFVYAVNPNKQHFYHETKGWGYAKFIPIKDLFDEEMGYVENDSILVAANIKVFPSI